MPKRGRDAALAGQGDLFADAPSPLVGMSLAGRTWPAQHSFPVNYPGAKVRDVVWDDLASSPTALIVAGFASITQIIELAAHAAHQGRPSSLRVVLGTEPFATERITFGSPRAAFTAEARQYWEQEQGVSLRLSAKIVHTIRALEEGWFQVRFMPGPDRLHAKMFVAERALTMGSSNFTSNGLSRQLEANVRFGSMGGQKYAYRDARLIAENYWAEGEDWSADLIGLLRDMLQHVSWPEAIARAAADLLEGGWAAKYLSGSSSSTLWPSQRSGIAEALLVYDNFGSVLVADATGSGKTRFGAHLLRALRDRLWDSGRAGRGMLVVVSPPAVGPAWEREAALAGLTIRAVSSGALSNKADTLRDFEVDQAEILAVDEAHNFLAPDSKRTRKIRDSGADHVVMFTATPINRSARDLLSLVDLLGADNFEDATLEILDRLGMRGPAAQLVSDEWDQLRRETQRFTVRRTKTQLNALVDLEPAAYEHPVTGRTCRYPVHDQREYATGESEQDVEVASQIRLLVTQLKGLANLQSKITAAPAGLGFTDQRWLDMRLGAARGNAAHLVLAVMRSSRAALLEHLRGTSAAAELLNLTGFAKTVSTGDVLGKLARAMVKGPPGADLHCPVPEWLTDPDAWQVECARELEVYRRIDALALTIGDARERTKADLIRKLTRRHERVLAFDHHPITLSAIAPLLEGCGAPVHVATGANDASKGAVRAQFAPEATAPGVALCSDAMNEGINLQGASTVVLFDIPSTMRVAEQRVGRVDRMDSPYDTIEVWWPKDGPAFATRADELLATRSTESTNLLGSNLPIPGLDNLGNGIVDSSAFAGVGDREDDAWGGFTDALDPVRRLVHGPDAIISSSVYAMHRSTTHRLMASISTVQSSAPWAFFAVAGTGEGAPRWLLVQHEPDMTTTGFDQVSQLLRYLLADDPPGIPHDDTCARWLEVFLERATREEIKLLPRQHQKALVQMRGFAQLWAREARAEARFEVAERWDRIAACTRPAGLEQPVDLRHAADLWLEVIQPMRHAVRSTPKVRRRRYSLLSDVEPLLRSAPLDLLTVERALAGLRAVEPLENRVKACIIGVPTEPESPVNEEQ